MLNKLLEERRVLHNKKDKITKQYRELMLDKKKKEFQELIKNKRKIVVSVDIKEVNKLLKDYDNVREEILEVEDEINRIDTELLDHIIQPNPEDINDALDIYNEDEWKQI